MDMKQGVSVYDDEHFMREALAEARLAAAEGEVPIGAVVVHDGEVIARAHNRREADADPSAHAEFSAMVAAARALGRWRLTGCTVYVTLEPCCMCAGLMVNARIDRCVYGAADPKGGAAGSLYRLHDDERLNHAFPVTAGVLGDECAELLSAFFASRRAGEVVGGAPAPQEVCASVRVSRNERLAALPPARALLAVDSFKGSATSAEAETWLAEGAQRAAAQLGRPVEVRAIPVADGGEGTLDAVRAARGGEEVLCSVRGPLGGAVDATYLRTTDASGAPIAVVEMARAAGLSFTSRTEADALAASTAGVGALVRAAVEAGARTIYLGLGGSATNDGGAGFLQALGAELLQKDGVPVAPGLAGLEHLAHIDLAPARRLLKGVTLVALTDVRAPLVGARGALRVFGPQKGLPKEGELTDAAEGWMVRYAAELTLARDALDGTDLAVDVPGARPRALAGVPVAGAAGGLGAAVLALGGSLVSGIDAVLDLAAFDAAARTADVVITGEGALDEQTASGKVPVGVARRAKRANPRALVVAVCGARADDLGEVYAEGIDVALPILRRPMPLAEALDPAETCVNLIAAGETAVRTALRRL